ncbi:Tn3 family transposase [Klebsiella pasteurii]|uniref:Tn3 family transposase n=1 Tax=unclassified Klebsiella TaxID=2608929 RepID=UPI00237C3734|nr:Tn3 family transposase [Klebsiella pasteurii]MDD9665728.1 Tn3 family transposase [Klebsiella pasteurii]MDD9671202.1 Tn3 family transposase [Klebsiella pasteurii]MDD9687319.1 Tn3 family transposase [Klebsiella pasteurii]
MTDCCSPGRYVHGQEAIDRRLKFQTIQLGALALVTNAVVLWNSLYMQEALSHIRTTTGKTPEYEHIARLSPLIHGHINMPGHYTFTLPEDILKGELRPLNLNVNNEVSP